MDQLHTSLYIPYQGLQLLGYRFAGKQCRYEWGKSIVRPIGSVTAKQQLMGLLFPVLVFWLILVLELGLIIYMLLHLYARLSWLIIPLIILAVIPLSPYFYQILFDSWRIYRLLKRYLKTSRLVSRGPPPA